MVIGVTCACVGFGIIDFFIRITGCLQFALTVYRHIAFFTRTASGSARPMVIGVAYTCVGFGNIDFAFSITGFYGLTCVLDLCISGVTHKRTRGFGIERTHRGGILNDGTGFISSQFDECSVLTPRLVRSLVIADHCAVRNVSALATGAIGAASIQTGIAIHLPVLVIGTIRPF